MNTSHILDSLLRAPSTEEGTCERWVRVHSSCMVVALSIAAWVGGSLFVLTYCLIAFSVLLVQLRGRWTPDARFGLANTLTSLRLLATMALAVLHHGAPGVVVVGVALAICGVDILDGWVARRMGSASPFGTVYDVEVDTVLVVALLFLLVERAQVGPWILFVCYWHYLYFLAPVFFPTTVGAVSRSRFGRTIYTVMMLAFMLAFVVPAPWASVTAGVGAVAVSASFVVSFWHRYRRVAPS